MGKQVCSARLSKPIGTVLLVDDYAGFLESAGRLLRRHGLVVHEASTLAQALDAACRHHLDLTLIDLRLGGLTGLDVAKALQDAGVAVPWVLVSRFMDYDMACKAGQLGAQTAVQSPFSVDEVVLQALATLRSQRAGGWPRLPVGARVRKPASTARLVAWWILQACDSMDDLPTFEAWREVAGVSYTRLRDACYALQINPPDDAKLFMRVFRALVRGGGQVGHLEAELAFSDIRTFDALFERSGLAGLSRADIVSLDQFLSRQRFIAPDHPLLQALRSMLAGL